MGEAILRRIEREHGLAGVAERLGALPGGDWSSLLLEVVRSRNARLRPADVLARYEQDRFVRPSPSDPRRLAQAELDAYALLPQGFDVVELSPLVPAGTVALGGLSPDVAVSTARNGEVSSDVTNALALEAAVRRKADPAAVVRLAACARVVRAQRYDDPELQPHFLLFGLVTAGRAQPEHRFERAALREHLVFHRALAGPSARLLLTPLAEAAEPLCRDLAEELPATLDPGRSTGRGYYRTVSLAVETDRGGVADGGFVDWTARLLGNAKERLLISGVGLERLAA